MHIVLIISFIIISLLHLVTCYFKIEKLRMITKPLLLALLAGIYYSVTIEKGTFHWQVLVALLLGMIGDTFLLSNKKSMFICGAFFFSFGHVFYFYSIVSFTPLKDYTPPIFLIAIIAIFVGACLFLLSKLMFPHLTKDLRPMFPIYIGLVFILFSLSLLTLFATISNAQESILPAVILTLGSLSFLISDNKLAYDKFKRATKYGNFHIMLTYIIAQTCLTAGLIML